MSKSIWVLFRIAHQMLFASYIKCKNDGKATNHVFFKWAATAKGKFSCTCSEIQRTVTNDMFPYLVKQPLSHTFLFLTYRPVIQKNYFKRIQSFLVFLAGISEGTQKPLNCDFCLN